MSPELLVEQHSLCS